MHGIWLFIPLTALGCLSSPSESLATQAPAEDNSLVPELVADEDPSEKPEIVPWLAGSSKHPYPIQGTKYPIANAIDRKFTTTWVANKDVGTFYFPLHRPTTFLIVPGFAKRQDLWIANRRVTRLRYRYISKGTNRFKPMVHPWHDVTMDPPDQLPTDPYVTIDVIAPAEPVIAMQIEVLDAKKGTRYDDICISSLLFQGVPLSAVEHNPTWTYASANPVIPNTGEFSDHMEARFDSYNFDTCALSHDGTGGGNRRWKGTCTPSAKGMRIHGQILGECYGMTAHPPWCDPTDASGNKDVDTDLTVHTVNKCFAVIDGHPFHRTGCQ